MDVKISFDKYRNKKILALAPSTICTPYPQTQLGFDLAGFAKNILANNSTFVCSINKAIAATFDPSQAGHMPNMVALHQLINSATAQIGCTVQAVINCFITSFKLDGNIVFWKW